MRLAPRLRELITSRAHSASHTITTLSHCSQVRSKLHLTDIPTTFFDIAIGVMYNDIDNGCSRDGDGLTCTLVGLLMPTWNSYNELSTFACTASVGD